MSGANGQITIDFDAFARQVNAVEAIADAVSPAIEAGRSTGGLDAAHAFGLLCAGMNVPATLVSRTVTDAMSLSQEYLRSIVDRARAGNQDFIELEQAICDIARTAGEAVEDVPGMGS